MNNFSPFITVKTTKYKECSINVKTVALVISDGAYRCRLYVTGDPVGVELDMGRASVMQLIEDKLKEIYYA